MKLTSRQITGLSTALAACALLFAPAAQAYEGASSGTWRITARVPIACWVQPVEPVVAASGQTGQVIEACNSPGGYTVSATYRTLLPSEAAHMVYGDQRVELSRTGGQLLGRSTLATIRRVGYRFDEVTLETPLILAVVIQPI